MESLRTLEIRLTGSPRLVSDSVLRWSSLGLTLLQPATPIIRAPSRVRRVTQACRFMRVLPWDCQGFSSAQGTLAQQACGAGGSVGSAVEYSAAGQRGRLAQVC